MLQRQIQGKHFNFEKRNLLHELAIVEMSLSVDLIFSWKIRISLENLFHTNMSRMLIIPYSDCCLELDSTISSHFKLSACNSCQNVIFPFLQKCKASPRGLSQSLSHWTAVINTNCLTEYYNLVLLVPSC